MPPSRKGLTEWIEFRLKYPALGGLRCAACKMRGGIYVNRDELARELESLPENRGRKVEVGSRVEMAPCLSDAALTNQDAFWQQQGRPCPYIGLDDKNDTAATILLNHLPEHTRPLTPALADALLADASDDERASTLLRVSLALRSNAVIEKLYPSVDDDTKR